MNMGAWLLISTCMGSINCTINTVVTVDTLKTVLFTNSVYAFSSAAMNDVNQRTRLVPGCSFGLSNSGFRGY